MSMHRVGEARERRPSLMVIMMAAAWLSGCSKSHVPDASSASNWLTCNSLTDCAGDARAVACDDGYCVDESGEPLRLDDDLSSTAGGDGSWTKLPAPPVSGRVGSLVASVGDTVIVAGGWDFLCPPGAGCVPPTTPPYADGAVYDLTTGRWEEIADAPLGFRGVTAAVVDKDIYALSQCEEGPTCPAGGSLLRYRSEADEWDLLPGPANIGNYRLLRTADGLVAYRASDEGSSLSDYRFLPGEQRWVPLPDDPLPPVYDRFVVEYQGRLMVFGTPLEAGDDKTKLAAAYDPDSQTWEELAGSKSQGYQVWRAGSVLYLNPHFSSAGGGIYDPSENVWRPLSNPPHHDLAGVLAEDEAIYEYASGWVLDARTGDWLEISPRPDSSDIYEEAIAESPHHGMVVFGGQTWTGDDGELLNDAWLWTPPAALVPSQQ